MIHLLRGLYYGIYSAKDFRCRDNKCLFFQREPFLKIDFFLQDISCLSEGNIYFSMITLMLLMSLSDSEDIVPLFYFFFFFCCGPVFIWNSVCVKMLSCKFTHLENLPSVSVMYWTSASVFLKP